MTKLLPVTEEQRLPELALLAREIWEEHYMSLLGQEQIDYMLDKFQSPEAIKEQMQDGYRYFFLHNGGETAGYLGIQLKNKELFLSKLYVREAFRQKGIAKDVLSFLKELCKKEKLSKIWLTVNRHNDGSVAAYKKMGFHTVREQDAEIGNGYIMDDYIMEILP